MSAYEELKAWCEKHLTPDDYKIIPESRSYDTTIYFTDCGVGFIGFDRNGEVGKLGGLDDDDDMFEHINEVEREEKSSSKIITDPPLTYIGGMMVRKMIEFYERQDADKENRG